MDSSHLIFLIKNADSKMQIMRNATKRYVEHDGTAKEFAGAHEEMKTCAADFALADHWVQEELDRLSR